ncbi:unnamed protein product [Chondrus crispus]|uniref:catalase n=1 Tax=Chondrus crispus TaxID=2769 RepID=R7QFJ3_CHOCR|nr:unnamed protein product [Chondrus crispus]CDF37302.1 unnamed protein product [Chondrus crispus]|eukprot:XP_005717121.1 unnamed protein product [Chondrus crispus]
MSLTSAFLLVILSLSLSAAREFLTGDTGHHVGSNQNSQTATKSGGILLQDIYALQKLRRFNTERIPERVVHGRGAGAHGEFRSFGNFSDLTAAEFLSKRGIETEVFVRFSTVIHGKHSPETVRDPRGFAVKFKTATEGNYDLVGNNLPVFFIRDHLKFPDMVHSLKPDPVTNLQDPNRYFDFFSALGGMATHMLTYLYSDLGIPRGYRFMDGHSVNAYKMVNAKKQVKYVKFRWLSKQGVQNLTRAEAAQVQGADFSHATRDLYDAIRRGDFPTWELGVQVMDPSQLDDFDFNPLDASKDWPARQFPFTALGELKLNRVPDNFHLASEQSAFSPGNFLPGKIEPSEDRLLQGRLVSYHESQMHRHGSNTFQYLPVNRAKSAVRNYNQDGVMVMEHAWKGSVNYEPSNDADAYVEDKRSLYSTREICGKNEQGPIEKTLNFRQAGELYRAFSEQQRANLVGNLAVELRTLRSQKILHTMCAHLYKADEEYGRRVAEAAGCTLAKVREIASGLKE